MLLLLFTGTLQAATQATVEEYIQQYKDIAIREMKKYGIPASITLAQGILESGMGTSILATKGNNHFGIKCHQEWSGKTMKHTDDAPNECFRVYAHAEESYIDHSLFLTTRPRYSSLFNLGSTDYKGWAYGLKKAGYATNPKYAEMLIDCIERNQLYVYDQDISMSEMESKRYNIKEREKEAIIALQGKPSTIKRGDQEIIVEVPVAKSPVTLTKDKAGVTFLNNHVKTVYVKSGQTPKMVADAHYISVKKFCEYNDITANSPLKEGQLVYLQPKKNKNKKHKTHLVLKHENMWMISQLYAVKLEKLYERNLMKYGEEPAEGTLVYINKVAPRKPLLRTGNNSVGHNDPEPVVGTIKTTKTEATVQPKPVPAYETPVTDKTETPAIVVAPFGKPAPVVVKQNPTTPSNPSAIRHIVIKGDTLYNISKRYGVSVEQIKIWNNLTDESIKLGQEIVINP